MKLAKVISIFLFFTAFDIFAQDTTGQIIDSAMSLLSTNKSEFKKGHRIIGLAVFRHNDFDYPIKAHRVVLLNENKTILNGSTNLDGTF